MPTFMGTLALNEKNELVAPTAATICAPAIAADGGGVGWVPSGGKKLETGLSIVLENVTSGFRRPNVIDLKLGARLWADEAPEAKRKKLDEVSEGTTSGSLGFRIAGMKIYRPDGRGKGGRRCQECVDVGEDGYLSFDKFYGRVFSAENVREAFVEFLGAEEDLRKQGRTKDVAKRLAKEVRALASVLEKEESRMYSASILMVYEGDERAMEAAFEDEERRAATRATGAGNGEERDEDSKEDDDENEEEKPKIYDMRVIDFAHARWTPGQGPDDNALQGIRSVLKILERLAAEEIV